MRILEPLLHFFTPRHTNNHKAKALQISAIFSYIVLLLVVQVVITTINKVRPGVLGYASNITVADLLKYTNEKRISAGQSNLLLNDQLAEAAKAKAADMFEHQYWAHTSPDGRDPWSFITQSGYTYLFAGENLARDFGDSKSVVDAWMNSPSHKENLLNPRYQEIGFAVVNGRYKNYETTLVVQMFGARTAAIPTVESEKIEPVSVASPVVLPSSQVDIFELTKLISIGLLAILILVLVVDGVLAYRRKTARLSGHNLAHMMFLLAVLIIMNLIGRGLIM